MSGFKDDILSILRDNVMLHSEAMGLVMEGWQYPGSAELLKELEDRKFPVTDRADKHVFLFDYVVIPEDMLYVNILLKAFTLVNKLGLIIIDVSGKHPVFHKNFVSIFANFTAHKLTYQDRVYLVIKNGIDYGN